MAVLKVIWPYLFALVVGGAIVYGVHRMLDNSYELGKVQGALEQKRKQSDADLLEKERRDLEKEGIEREAQNRIAASQADAALAAASADRLRSELDRIRKLAEAYTGAQPAGKSTSSIIIMLADMLEDSNRSYRLTAKEADNYYDAGLTCQNQYNSLRGKYNATVESKGAIVKAD